MTWVIHKGDRRHLYNIEACKQIFLSDSRIWLEYDYDDKYPLDFETDAEAAQAFSYLRESIKRGENLLNI